MKDQLLCQNIIIPEKRRFQILYERLRTNRSALNNDLFLKRIFDSPYCRRGAIENAFHFFLNCPQYARQRADLIHNVSQHVTVSLRVSYLGTVHSPPRQTQPYLRQYINIFGTQRDFKSLL